MHFAQLINRWKSASLRLTLCAPERVSLLSWSSFLFLGHPLRITAEMSVNHFWRLPQFSASFPIPGTLKTILRLNNNCSWWTVVKDSQRMNEPNLTWKEIRVRNLGRHSYPVTKNTFVNYFSKLGLMPFMFDSSCTITALGLLQRSKGSPGARGGN